PGGGPPPPSWRLRRRPGRSCAHRQLAGAADGGGLAVAPDDGGVEPVAVAARGAERRTLLADQHQLGAARGGRDGDAGGPAGRLLHGDPPLCEWGCPSSEGVGAPFRGERVGGGNPLPSRSFWFHRRAFFPRLQ